MKEVKQKPKMKDAKILDAASRAPRNMKDTMMRMRDQAPDRASDQEATTEYGEKVMRDGMDRVTNATVHAVDSSIHKAREKTQESYTDHSTYKGGKDYAEKQAQSAYTADTHKPLGHYSQAPKTQPKNTVSSIKQGTEKSAKTTQRAVKTGRKTLKITTKTIKTAKTAKKAVKTSQKAARAAKEAAKKTAQGAKALVRTVIQGIKAVINAIRELVIAIASGGWVAVLIILFLGVVAFILMSAFGVFTADELTPDKPMSKMVYLINAEHEASVYNNVERLSTGAFDEVKVIYKGDADGDSASVNNWNDVIAVYAVLTTTDEVNPMAVATVNLENEEKLREVFNTMNTVSYDDKIVVEEVEVTDEEGNTKTEEKLVRYIYVTMHSMDYLEAAELYGFNEEQREILEAMMDPEFDKYYAEIIGIDLLDGADPTKIISNLPPNSKGSEVVKAAVTKLGAPYVLGAKGDKKFDCSGLAYWAINQVDPELGGIMYTNAAGQAKYCYNNNKVVGESELQPGDLVFWQNLGCDGCHRWKEIHHVGIYMGDGKVIEASSSKGRVVIRDLWSSAGYPLFMYGRPY